MELRRNHFVTVVSPSITSSEMETAPPTPAASSPPPAQTHRIDEANIWRGLPISALPPKAEMMPLFSVQCVRGCHDAPGHSLGRDLKAFSGEPPAFQACLIVV